MNKRSQKYFLQKRQIMLPAKIVHVGMADVIRTEPVNYVATKKRNAPGEYEITKEKRN